MEFTYKAYEKMIKQLHARGYKIADYKNYVNYDKVAILRHDVDYSLFKAYQLSEQERKLGVQSTYFVLLTSDFYNVASKQSTDLLKKIIANGHNIGLHFDEMRYNEESHFSREAVAYNIKKEVNVFEQIVDTQIDTISMHRPSKQTLESDLKISGLINSYGYEFFKGFKYISDSRRMWREDVDNIIESESFQKLHILTHAFWYNDKEIDIKESIFNYVKAANTERYKTMSENISNLDEILKIEEL